MTDAARETGPRRRDPARPDLAVPTPVGHVDLGAPLARPVHFLGDVRFTRWPLSGPLLPKLGVVPLHDPASDGAVAMAVLLRH